MAATLTSSLLGPYTVDMIRVWDLLSIVGYSKFVSKRLWNYSQYYIWINHNEREYTSSMTIIYPKTSEWCVSPLIGFTYVWSLIWARKVIPLEVMSVGIYFHTILIVEIIRFPRIPVAVCLGVHWIQSRSPRPLIINLTSTNPPFLIT